MQPGSRSDQRFKLTCVKPTSEFALIRTHETLLVAELKWITSCHRGSRTAADIETDTDKQLRKNESEKGEKVQKLLSFPPTPESLYCLALGQNSNLNQVDAYKSFLSASGKQCMHTAGQHIHTHTPHPQKNGNIIRIHESPARHGTAPFSKEGVSVTSWLKNSQRNKPDSGFRLIVLQRHRAFIVKKRGRTCERLGERTITAHVATCSLRVRLHVREGLNLY